MLSKILKFLPKNQIADECRDEAGFLMTRYYLTPKIFGFRLVIHQFHRSDNDRHYHDHPWNFISVILKGSYIEHYPFPDDGWLTIKEGIKYTIRGCDIQQAHRRWDIIKRPKFWKHWVELPKHNIWANGFQECWTLVLLYGKRRDWGFWTEKGWIKHDKYDCRGDYASNTTTKDGHDGSMRAY